MLKIIIDKDTVHVESNATGIELLANLTLAINDLYTGFLSEDPDYAEMFRYCLTECISDPKSQVWTHRPEPNGKTMISRIRRGVKC